ncbi:MAG: hypothetical protein K2H59_07560 [Muribaculaceae bacterium]|nr:hypothetical protein [Muribaculaceae bacterium]
MSDAQASRIRTCHKYIILMMMHVSGHKTQKTFMDYIKLSSEEIADELKTDELP